MTPPDLVISDYAVRKPIFPIITVTNTGAVSNPNNSLSEAEINNGRKIKLH